MSRLLLLDELSSCQVPAQKVGAILARLYERRPVNDATIEKIRSHLTAWAAGIPHHKVRDFGGSLSIREAVHVPFYRISLLIQYETRTVKRVKKPHRGGRIWPSRVSEQNIDVWSYTWPCAAEFRAAENDYPIQESESVIECESCAGEGKTRCATCGATGWLRCPKCGGAGSIVLSRRVTRWRTVMNRAGAWVNEPYEDSESYSEQCVRCAATGKVTCGNCSGSGTLQCATCHGSGKMVSMLVVKDSFDAQEDASIHPNAQCMQHLAAVIQDASQYRPLVSLLGGEISLDGIAPIENTRLQGAIDAALASARSRCTPTRRIVKQRLTIGMADVLYIAYEFEGEPYDLWLAGRGWAVHAPMNPFVTLVEKSVAWAAHRLERGEIGEGLSVLQRCADMRQADDVVEHVFRSFRTRLADAYAGKAASLGAWSAESLYYSDRARQLDQRHRAALAHENSVTRALGAITLLPAIVAAVMCAVVAYTMGRADAVLIGAPTALLLSAVLWAGYGRRALNTVAVLGLSLLGASACGAAFYNVAAQCSVANQHPWLHSGATALVLLLAMAVTAALLPRGLRREGLHLANHLRESLSRAQSLFAEDWDDVKEFYGAGGPAAAPARHPAKRKAFRGWPHSPTTSKVEVNATAERKSPSAPSALRRLVSNAKGKVVALATRMRQLTRHRTGREIGRAQTEEANGGCNDTKS